MPNGPKFRRRIGIETLDQTRNSITCYIDNLKDLTYPVIPGLDSKRAFVAYTKTDGQASSVMFETFQIWGE